MVADLKEAEDDLEEMWEEVAVETRFDNNWYKHNHFVQKCYK